MAEFSSLTWPPHSHGLGLGLQSGGESWRKGEPALGYRGSQSATRCGTHDSVAPACCLTLEKGLRGAKAGGSSDPPEGVSHEEKGQLRVSSQCLARGCEARAGSSCGQAWGRGTGFLPATRALWQRCWPLWGMDNTAWGRRLTSAVVFIPGRLSEEACRRSVPVVGV